MSAGSPEAGRVGGPEAERGLRVTPLDGRERYALQGVTPQSVPGSPLGRRYAWSGIGAAEATCDRLLSLGATR